MNDQFKMTLRQYANLMELDVSSFLTVATALAELVVKLHQDGITTTVLNPDLIVYQPDAGRCTLSSVPLSFPVDANRSYPYMAPEETGRMQRSADGRSHLYVLGIIYYELLTGQLPYESSTPEEWVYAHMAVSPKTLRDANPAIPAMICDLITKLLSKSVEERYQSPHGLILDLQRCSDAWKETGRIEPFVPEQVYEAKRFQIPQTLHGRDTHMDALLSAWERVRSGRVEITLLTGASGCGKTMLVKEFERTLTKQKTYFISGKFDQFMRDVPLLPIVRAFQDLVRQILAESPDRIDRWRTKLLEALGHSGSVIAEVIPEITLITGELRPVEALPPAEATRRFRQMFLRFVQVFADMPEQPLILFLDDLQWADLGSLQFLRILLNVPRRSNLLFIGAFRENELQDDHPLRDLLNGELNNRNIHVQTLRMTEFKLSEVLGFVAETVHRDRAECRLLAETLFRKTAGNPYYLSQILQTSYQDRLIYFDEDRVRCEWDLERIQEQEGSGDVLRLIVERFDKLPDRAKSALRTAACIGNTFTLSLLSSVCEQLTLVTENDLSDALYEGFVLPADAEHKQYSFLHDRVHQAIYDLLSPAELERVHLAVGRVLREQQRLARTDDSLLETVYHLNRARRLIVDSMERRDLAELSLRAARRAKASAAYETALNLLKSGIELVEADGLSSRDSLRFALLLELSECEYYCGNFDAARQNLNHLREHARNLEDWTNIFIMEITMYAYRNEHEEAKRLGTHAMADFGLMIPTAPTTLAIAWETLRTWWLFRVRKDPFEHSSQASEPHYEALSRIVTAAAPSISISNPRMSAILFSKYIRLARKRGTSEFLPLALTSYGLMLCLGFGRYKAANRLAEMAKPYVDRLNGVSIKGRTLQVIGMILLFNQPWDAEPYFRRGAAYSLESGDLLFGGYGVVLHVVNFFGDLRSLFSLCVDYVETASQNLDSVTMRGLKKTLEYVRMLQGTSVGPISEVIREDGLFPEQNMWIRNHYYYSYTCQIEARYILGQYADVLELSKRAERWREDSNTIPARNQCYYTFLATSATFSSVPPEDRSKLRKLLVGMLRRMKKWVRTAGEGTRPKYLLMSAEMARLSGKDMQAVQLYDLAVRSAKEDGVEGLQYEAIAHELAARYYRSKGEEREAANHMRYACAGYLQWGAVGKVTLLCELYPDWLAAFTDVDHAWLREDAEAAVAREASDVQGRLPLEDLAPPPSVDATLGSELDVSTIRRAAQIIVNEAAAEHDRLPQQFLRLVLMNAGAQRGFIMREKDRHWFLEATHGIHQVGSLPDDGRSDLDFSASIVQYVLRTRDPVVLGEARWSMFAADPYVSEKRPRSILCFPIRYPDSGVGAVYLENNLIADALTADRLEVLDMVFSRMMHLQSLHGYGEVREDATDATESGREHSHPALVESLTKREMEILRLMAEGLSNKEIAKQLAVTEGTIKNHGLNIYGKLQVKRRTQAVSKARELNLIE